MAGGSGGRSLEKTPTWAVAVVCFVLVFISILIEHIIHLIGKWFTKKRKRALYEALEKIKSVDVAGVYIVAPNSRGSLISKICIPESVANKWHPCSKKQENLNKTKGIENIEHRRKLLALAASSGSLRRALAETSSADECAKGKVPFVSSDGIHQLHIFIFVLAVFHVLYCVLTMVLGRAKMRSWKRWETETRTAEYQFSHDPERFRLARETSFGRRHLNFWTKTPGLIWIVCFFRQFFWSVPKVDYLTLRHGFIMAHLAPQSQTKFNFQNYIKRSLEEDFKVVVGISPPIWLFAVLFLLSNTHGWYSYLWLPFIPLIVILLVGTKLQVIITKMGIKILERGMVVKGVPVVQPGDDLFWFNRPRLTLYLINFVLFQNAFQLAFFAWSWSEFGLKSCFHEHKEDIVIRITMGVLIQILCSYVTLPLYALVTQMGSSMKPTIFNENVAKALKNWHHVAKKHIKQNKGSVSPMSSRPTTPSHHASPIHLLRHHRSEIGSFNTSPRRLTEQWDTDSPSLSHHDYGEGSSSTHHQIEQGYYLEYNREVNEPEPNPDQHEIHIEVSKEFSFDKRTSL